MERRTRVLLLTPDIGGGGAQHVMLLVARGLSREKFEVHLGLVRAGDPGADAAPPRVRVHALGPGRARAATLRLLRLVWRLRPDVILSSAPEISFLALLLRPFFPARTRVLVRQNGTVSRPGSWRRAALHTLALPVALSASRSRDLPIPRHGGGSDARDRSSG